MNIRIRTKGFQEARRFLKRSATILAGTQGRFYPQQTRIIKQAILANADSCYTNSPAKEIALKSCETWRHEGRKHINDIESTDYANYKQYGCGGLEIKVLVDIDERFQNDMMVAAVQELGSI
jgi:hypothetical protein